MRDIKLLVMDVDGTLTDGHIYIGINGEMMKSFNVKDGYAISRLRDYGIEPVIITGRNSDIVQIRANELRITELYQGVEDKLEKLKSIVATLKVKSEEVAYIGDDLNDLDCIKYCGVTGCPNDAVSVVRQEVQYICKANGGQGAVREFIEWLESIVSIGEM